MPKCIRACHTVTKSLNFLNYIMPCRRQFDTVSIKIARLANLRSGAVVLKLETAVPLGIAKQFQGDRKEVADF